MKFVPDGLSLLKAINLVLRKMHQHIRKNEIRIENLESRSTGVVREPFETYPHQLNLEP